MNALGTPRPQARASAQLGLRTTPQLGTGHPQTPSHPLSIRRIKDYGSRLVHLRIFNRCAIIHLNKNFALSRR